MSPLIRSELLKLRTTRTFLGISLAALGLTALIAGASAAAGSYDGDAQAGRDLLTVGGLAQPFALVLGILAVSTEFRHGTITPSLLAVPSRARLVAAKLVAHALAGLVLGLLAFGVSALLALPILAARDIPSDLDAGTAFDLVAGGVACVTLLATFGVGFGAVVRNQVGAVIGAIGWWFVVEPLIATVPGIGESVEKYGLGGAINAVTDERFGGAAELSQVAGGLLLIGYVALFAAAGIAVLRGRDVTT